MRYRLLQGDPDDTDPQVQLKVGDNRPVYVAPAPLDGWPDIVFITTDKEGPVPPSTPAELDNWDDEVVSIPMNDGDADRMFKAGTKYREGMAALRARLESAFKRFCDEDVTQFEDSAHALMQEYLPVALALEDRVKEVNDGIKVTEKLAEAMAEDTREREEAARDVTLGERLFQVHIETFSNETNVVHRAECKIHARNMKYATLVDYEPTIDKPLPLTQKHVRVRATGMWHLKQVSFFRYSKAQMKFCGVCKPAELLLRELLKWAGEETAREFVRWVRSLEHVKKTTSLNLVRDTWREATGRTGFITDVVPSHLRMSVRDRFFSLLIHTSKGDENALTDEIVDAFATAGLRIADVEVVDDTVKTGHGYFQVRKMTDWEKRIFRNDPFMKLAASLIDVDPPE
jgi:hypothetical protein